MGKAQREYKARHKEAFICPNDSRRATVGIHCEICATKNRERTRRVMPIVKMRRVEMGHCRDCGAPYVEGISCPNCKGKAYRRKDLCSL